MLYQKDYKPTRKRPVLRVLGFVAVLFGCFIVARSVSGFKTRDVISPLPDVQTPSRSILSVLFSRKKDPEDLRSKVKTVAEGIWRNYSVLVIDLDSDFRMGINESVIYTAASINKVPILAALYYLYQRGDVNLDQTITLQENDIQDYGTGVIRYDPPGTSYSVKSLAGLMMQKSDNTAAYLLANYVIGLDKIQQIMNDWGMRQTDMVNNKTSNNDIAALFEKIINGKIANNAYTQEMLDFLKNSDFEDRLPALLPPDTTVYHKIGTAAGAIHDVGIVLTKKHRYYIGILTSDITDEKATAKKIAEISKLVYDFLN